MHYMHVFISVRFFPRPCTTCTTCTFSSILYVRLLSPPRGDEPVVLKNPIFLRSLRPDRGRADIVPKIESRTSTTSSTTEQTLMFGGDRPPGEELVDSTTVDVFLETGKNVVGTVLPLFSRVSPVAQSSCRLVEFMRTSRSRSSRRSS